MQVSVEATSSLERKMTITVPAHRIGDEVKKRLEETAKTAKIDGFRVGKVPVNVVNQRYGQGIRKEVVSEKVRECFYEAVTKEKVTPASPPNIEPKIDKPGEDLQFIATFEVLPDFDLADLKQVKVSIPSAEVKDSDIDVMIDGLRKQHANWIEVDRPAAHGDEATIDYVGIKDNKESLLKEFNPGNIRESLSKSSPPTIIFLPLCSTLYLLAFLPPPSFALSFPITLTFSNFPFILTFAIAALLLSFDGLDFLTCISAAASAISNVGPGLGEIIGPLGDYSSLTSYSKIVLIFTMFLGRLEMLTVLILFIPSFWKD